MSSKPTMATSWGTRIPKTLCEGLHGAQRHLVVGHHERVERYLPFVEKDLIARAPEGQLKAPVVTQLGSTKSPRSAMVDSKTRRLEAASALASGPAMKPIRR